MNEGFADYWAASSLVGSGPLENPNLFDFMMAPWNSSVFPPDSDFRRVLNSSKHYPEDIVGEPHQDGEIWSAALWQIMTTVGKERTDKLFFDGLKRVGKRRQFFNMARALLQANSSLYGGLDQEALTEIFRDRGIFLTLTGLTLEQSTLIGGSNTTGTVFLSNTLGNGEATVLLYSSNPAVTIPSEVSIASKEDSIDFEIETIPVAEPTFGEIFASFDTQTVSVSIEVIP